MTTDTSDVRDARTLAQRVTMSLFKATLVAFPLLGTVVVLCQAMGVAARDAGLVSGVVDGLGKAMTTTAGAAGLLAFVMSYLFRWDAGDED